jgi:hypothetical protein
METPSPVNLNALTNILGNAKKIMNKVETNDYTSGHVDARALTEDGVKQLKNKGVTRPMNQNSTTSQATSDYTEEQVRNSKFPEAVKKAMLENKIPKISMTPTSFSLNDVSDLIDEKPMGLPKTPKTAIRENVISNNYSTNSDLLTISKSELKSMIHESIAHFFKQSYDEANKKAITDEAIKRTINMLIKEGKINVRPK